MGKTETINPRQEKLQGAHQGERPCYV